MSDAAQAAGADAATAAETTTTTVAQLLGEGQAGAAQADVDANAFKAFLRGDEATGSAEPNSFLDAIEDEDLKAYADRKGFKSATDLAKSYANLERLMSGDKAGRIVLPADENDAEGFERVAKALGRPDTPEGYGLTELAGADAEFAGNAAKWLHDAGVPAGRAAKLAESWNAYVSERANAEAQAAEQRDNAELAGLRSEWGPDFDKQVEISRRAAKQFGISGAKLDALTQTWGVGDTMRFLNGIGKGLGEDTFVQGDGKSSFGVSVEQAAARMDALKRDTEWQSRWMSGGAAEKEEWSRLSSIVSKAAS
jgi:hypothetical protein